MRINGYRVSNHIWEQAEAKGIPSEAVVAVLEARTQIYWVRVNGLGSCQRCGNDKHEHNGVLVGKDNKRHAIGIIVCETCKSAITVYKTYNEGCTPIRADQPKVTHYHRECGDCGRRFRITARTWEKLSEQTTHKCRGKVVDLIAKDDKDKRGRYFLRK